MLDIEEFRANPELMFDFFDFFLKFKPHEYQKNFLLACLNEKRIAGKWSRQSGKSFSVAGFCTFITTISVTAVIIVAPTQTQSSELYSKIRDFVMSNEVLNSNLVKFTETELKFKNGSRIKALPSGIKGKSIRGFTGDIVILEEAGVMDDEIVDQVIMPMLASKKTEGQVIKIGTPLLKNHFYKSCFDPDTNYRVINVTWRDCVKAGQYSQEFVDEQKRNLTDIQFDTEYEAKFCEETASFFTSVLIDSCLEEYPLKEIL